MPVTGKPSMGTCDVMDCREAELQEVETDFGPIVQPRAGANHTKEALASGHVLLPALTGAIMGPGLYGARSLLDQTLDDGFLENGERP